MPTSATLTTPFSRPPVSATAARFCSHDLALAGYLKAIGYRLLDVEREAGGRCRFVFADRASRSRDVAAFFDESGVVSALKYSEALRLLKARVYGSDR